jgi:tetratricopeptide (TPR) repeat protein
MAEGNEFAAITEYKRYLYFANAGDSVEAAICEEIGVGLAWSGKQNEAVPWLQTSVRLSQSGTDRNARIMEAALIAAQTEQMEKAYMLLRMIDTSGVDTVWRGRLALCNALIHAKRGEWREAFHAYSQYLKINPEIDWQFEHWTQQNSPPRDKSKIVGVVSSALLPGMGQALAGDILDGVNAAAINGLMGYALVHAIASGTGADVALYSYLFLRYYVGNLITANEKTNKANRVQREKYLYLLLNEIFNEVCSQGKNK